MKKIVSLALCVVCVLTMLTGCSGQTADSSGEFKRAERGSDSSIAEVVKHGMSEAIGKMKLPDHKDIADDEEVDAVIEQKGSYERAKAMFALVKDEDGNSLYSPASLEMAIGMLSEGASDTARKQILGYIGVDDYAVLAEALMKHADITNEEDTTAGGFEAYDSNYKTVLNFANSVWVNDKYSLNKSFLDKVQTSYRARAEAVDVEDPVGACQTINDWCYETTNGLVQKVVTETMIVPDLSAILCNSVYFESAWWKPWSVREGTFTNKDGSQVKLDDMLHATVNTYYETDNAVAFSKGYVSGATFIGILPNEGVDIADIDLAALIASETTDYDVDISMPKLNYDFSSDAFIDSLKKFGIVDIFTENAKGLTNIVNESDDLFVSRIIQKCKIELDENGTKAAAVTAIAAMKSAAFVEPRPIKEVHLDRPFYYLIVDDVDVPGTILFIGSVNTIDCSDNT